MNKFLLSTFISGILIVILASFGYRFDIEIAYMFILLIPIIGGVRLNILLYEHPEQQEKGLDNNIFYNKYTESDKNAAAKLFYNRAKKTYPLLILIFSLIYISICTFKIINKDNEVNHYFTFVAGIILSLLMIILTGLYIHQKKRFFAKENIRTYAYIFLNFLIGLMLIAR